LCVGSSVARSRNATYAAAHAQAVAITNFTIGEARGNVKSYNRLRCSR
jgi:hypothetical protein